MSRILIVPWLLCLPLAASSGSTARAEEPRSQLERLDRDAVPESLRQWIRSLDPEDRRGAVRRLRRMDPSARSDFFRRWETMGERERSELSERFLRQRRRAREALLDRLGGHTRPSVDRSRAALADQGNPGRRALTPEERRRLRRQLARWEELSPEQRAKLRQRLNHLRQLSPDGRERIERNRSAWADMDAGRRDQMRARLRRFQTLTPRQQADLVDRRFADRPPAERRRILERLRRGAAAAARDPAPDPR